MSNLASSILVRFEPLRSIAFGSISGTYTGVGAPFANPIRLISIDNFTDENVLISFNGTDDNTVVASNGFKLFDYNSNKGEKAGLLEQPQGTRVYVKSESSNPSLGHVYVTVIYASQV
jgi:hypothetical protein